MRRRLVLAIAGVAAAAVVLFAVPLAIVLRSDHRDEELLRLQRDTIAATRTVDLGNAGRDPVELPPSSDRLAVYSRSGRRAAGDGPARADSVVREALRTSSAADHEAGGRLVAAVPLLSGERVAGVLRAERSDTAAARSTHTAWLALLGLAAGLIVLAVIAASLLARRLARPLDRLVVAARRLGEGNFAAKAPRGGFPEADQIAAALDQTAERLGELVGRERAFSEEASHQLRTPLAALRMELEAMELRGDSSAEVQSALAQVDRLQATIDTLLAIARGTPREASQSDVRALVRELEDRWRGRLAADARPLHFRGSERTAASASPAVVSEILDVLLENAYRHGRGAVTVTVRETGRWLAIDVGDEGPGFSDDGESAFRRGMSPEAGHGIGLPLARSLAEAEGGRLSVTRAAPAIVSLWLPRAGDAGGAEERGPQVSALPP